MAEGERKENMENVGEIAGHLSIIRSAMGRGEMKAALKIAFAVLCERICQLVTFPQFPHNVKKTSRKMLATYIDKLALFAFQ